MGMNGSASGGRVRRGRRGRDGSAAPGARPGLGVAALVALLMLLLGTARAGAQGGERPEAGPAVGDAAPSPWSFQAATYIWLPQTQGTLAARGATAHVDVDFGQMFDLLGAGDLLAAGGHVEIGYDRFSFFLDAFGGTARPVSDVTLGPRQMQSGTADVTMNFAFFEFGPAYRVLEWPRSGPGRPIEIDLLTGGRFMYFYQSVTLRGGRDLFAGYANATSEWVDPFVGGRFAVPLMGDLDVVFRGDIGGFGAGSELAWNVLGGFRYALPWQPGGARTSIAAIYKVLDFDHASGSGTDEIVTKLALRGPAVGLVFDF